MSETGNLPQMPNISEIKGRIIEENFFRPKWYSVFLNPYFINRRSLQAGIRKFASATAPSARILDVGCGIKPYRGFFASRSYTGIDIRGGGHSEEAKLADAYYDGENIPFPDGSFDAAICTQVFEHAGDAEKLALEISRVLAAGGRAIITMPFMYPEHEIPHDFRRFTRYEHIRLLQKAGFEGIRIEKSTGIFGTFAQIAVVTLFEGISFPASILKALLTAFLFAPIQLKGLLLDAIFRKAGPSMDYIVTAAKPLKKP